MKRTFLIVIHNSDKVGGLGFAYIEGELLAFPDHWADGLFFLHKSFTNEALYHCSSIETGVQVAVGISEEDALEQLQGKIKKLDNYGNYKNWVVQSINKINDTLAAESIEQAA